jgi:catechol 2,3-dioxygenase-like lactoylglutathione lyase family enzyme
LARILYFVRGMRLDGIRLSVVDVGRAVDAYRTLLGVGAVGLEGGVERFQLARGAVEVARGVPGLAVCFAAERGDDLGAWPTAVEEHHGLDVRVISELPIESTVSRPDGIEAIDHVVVHTTSPDRAIAHWRDRLGLRLALDREFPERSLRLLFFRSGGLTLEFAAPLSSDRDMDAADVLYGVSFRAPDLDACRTRLLAAGLEVGEVHAGMKPDTRVASVHSGTVGVPTLLIEDPSRR